MKKEDIKILYVDDEEENLKAFKSAFRRHYTIYTANSAEEGMKVLLEEDISIVISDQRMPETTGVDFLCTIRKNYPDTIRMLMTAYSDVNTVIEAVNECQIYKYLNKPWDVKELKAIIDQAHEIYALRDENKRLVNDLLNINDKLDLLLKQTSIKLLLSKQPAKVSQVRRGFDDLVDFITKKDK